MLPILTLFTLAFSLVNALTIPQSGPVKRGAPAPLSLDFDVVRTPKNITTLVSRDEGEHKRLVPVSITNYANVEYILTIYLGSNQQPVLVQLDTGSSDLWVHSSSNGAPNTYDDSQSTTFQDLDEKFSIQYEDLSGYSGEYVTDSLSFLSGASLLDTFQFAEVPTDPNGEVGEKGVFGVADRNQESVSGSDPEYDSLPWALKNAGIIPKASYSLFLGSKASGKGTILFGGIDTAKYSGTLTTYPLSKTSGLGVKLNTINIDGKVITLNADYYLDSGTTLTNVPESVLDYLDMIIPSTKVTQDNGFVLRYVSCDQPTDKYFTFDFGQNTIKVSYADAIFAEGNKCLLGFSAGELFILGDTFLRSAYVYFDISDGTVGLAQASYSTDSNIISA